MVSGHQRVLTAVLAENCETPKLHRLRHLRGYDQFGTHEMQKAFTRISNYMRRKG